MSVLVGFASGVIITVILVVHAITLDTHLCNEARFKGVILEGCSSVGFKNNR